MATTVNATLKHKRGTEASMPILKDGQIYLCSDTHKMYKGTSTGDNILISDIAQLNDMTKNKQDKIEDSSWCTLPLNVNNTVTGYTPKYRKNGNLLGLRGKLNGVTANSTSIATLPDGFRPTETSTFTCCMNKSKKFTTCTIIIQANGSISFVNGGDGTAPSSDDEIYLNNITYVC